MLQGNFLKIPQNGDRGTIFCPAISESLTILDGHTHDGVNSLKVSANDIGKAEIILPSNAWVAHDGDYKQTVTLPSGYLFNSCNLRFILESGADAGSEIYPTIARLSATSFDVSIMLDNVSLRVVIS